MGYFEWEEGERDPKIERREKWRWKKLGKKKETLLFRSNRSCMVPPIHGGRNNQASSIVIHWSREIRKSIDRNPREMWLPNQKAATAAGVGNGERKSGGNGLVAVAIDRDKGSQQALKWAIDNLLLKGQTVVLIHVVNSKSAASSFSAPGNLIDPDSSSPSLGSITVFSSQLG